MAGGRAARPSCRVELSERITSLVDRDIGASLRSTLIGWRANLILQKDQLGAYLHAVTSANGP